MTPRESGSEGAAPLRPLGGSGAPGAPVRSEGSGNRRTFGFSNRTVAVALAVFALGYLVLAFQVPEYTAVNVPVQPGTLPRWLGAVLLVLAVLLFFQRTPDATDDEAAPEDEAADGGTAPRDGSDGDGPGAEDGGPAATGKGAASAPGCATGTGALGRLRDPRLEVALFVAALIVYVALFEPLGFILSTALYLGSTTVYLGYRRHVATAAVAVGVPLVLYLAMSEGLGVVLPSGPLPF
ncbi:tripartite tricarboxylate transporter TctB family protein [Nocardiopsis sp. FIRDI 009]|uniref:tripartite tricarboxylate transporter TctB family protein n=1 Tax=Nocardiopsis sp. FIRDI 009 TaxID=714197 RepID=UPI0018E4F1B0|nr:tripartite tricarboxylate transporter TctB family protein [Nocardiopsis sp. FIRDI 009]